jgi:hypothetical protein
MNDETSAQEIGMDRPAVRGGAEPPYRVCLARPIVCAGRDDCSGEGSCRFSSVILQGLSSRARKRGRQITAFHLAGDFCDLHTYVLKTLPDSVVAMTACEVAIVPHAQLDGYFVNPIAWRVYSGHRRLLMHRFSANGRFNRASISKCAPGPLVLRAVPPLQNGRIDQGYDLFTACHADRSKRRFGAVARPHEPHLRCFTFRRACDLCPANRDNP